MKEKIEIGYSPIPYTNGRIFHKFLIYTDSSGTEYYTRGGPMNELGVNTLEVFLRGFGKIKTVGGLGDGDVNAEGVMDPKGRKYEPGTVDFPADGQLPFHRDEVAQGDDLSSIWQKARETTKSPFRKGLSG